MQEKKPTREDDRAAGDSNETGDVAGDAIAREPEADGSASDGPADNRESLESDEIVSAAGGTLPELRESAHRIWLAGLGVMAAAEDEGTKLFRRMVERGEDLETRGREGLRDVRTKTEDRFEQARARTSDRIEEVGEKITESFDDSVAKVVRRSGVPTREEFQALVSRVEELERSTKGADQSDDD